MSKQSKLFGEEEIKVKTGLELSTAKEIADKILEMIELYYIRIDIVGSLRRERATINDIDFVVLTDNIDWKKISMKLIAAYDAKIVCAGDKILRILMPINYKVGVMYATEHVQVDFYRATTDTYGILKLIRTGSEEHNIWLAKYARTKYMRLLYSQGLLGLVDGKYRTIAGAVEEDVLRCLGIGWIEPQQREIVEGKPVWQK